MVENRFVGMKSRGVYEAPGMTLLYDALMCIEQLTMDRDLMHLRDRLAPEVAEMVYYGYWYTAKMDALAGVHSRGPEAHDRRGAAEPVQGQHPVDSRTSPEQSVRRGDRHDGRRAARTTRRTRKGFLRIQGLPSRVQGRVTPRTF